MELNSAGFKFSDFSHYSKWIVFWKWWLPDKNFSFALYHSFFLVAFSKEQFVHKKKNQMWEKIKFQI